MTNVGLAISPSPVLSVCCSIKPSRIVTEGGGGQAGKSEEEKVMRKEGGGRMLTAALLPTALAVREREIKGGVPR